MNRYFLEVCYMGARYAGFQVQQNALTVQEEVEKALQTLLRDKITLTGSSRTDTGVHAMQNYFHFDSEKALAQPMVYNINALLPGDIAVNRLIPVREDAHCRFDAIGREYRYTVYDKKAPFLQDRAYYYPYSLDAGLLQEAASAIMDYRDFTSFAKRNSQVKTFDCQIMESKWTVGDGQLWYDVRANRFLRGMVRGLVGTMLQVGRKKLTINEFVRIIEGKDSSRADFSVPGHGLCLRQVVYTKDYFMSK